MIQCIGTGGRFAVCPDEGHREPSALSSSSVQDRDNKEIINKTTQQEQESRKTAISAMRLGNYDQGGCRVLSVGTMRTVPSA